MTVQVLLPKTFLKLQFRFSKYTIFLPMDTFYFKIPLEVIEIQSVPNLHLTFHPIYLLHKEGISEHKGFWGLGRLPGNARIVPKGIFLLYRSHYDSLGDKIIFISTPSSSTKSLSMEPEYLPWQNKNNKEGKKTV